MMDMYYPCTSSTDNHISRCIHILIMNSSPFLMSCLLVTWYGNMTYWTVHCQIRKTGFRTYLIGVMVSLILHLIWKETTSTCLNHLIFASRPIDGEWTLPTRWTQETLQSEDMFQVLTARFTKHHHPNYDKLCPFFLNVPSETVKHMLNSTTQYARQSLSGPDMYKTQKSPFPHVMWAKDMKPLLLMPSIPIPRQLILEE